MPKVYGVLVLFLFFHFLLSLKSFPNKTLILNALPHLRESSLPSISADLQEVQPSVPLPGAPLNSLCPWDVGLPFPRAPCGGQP